MTFAEKIYQLRRQNGWSQEDLAQRLHVSRQSISKWENALSMPEGTKLSEIARLFQISLDDFGSGYSSLNTLGKLEIDELKLDREFLLSASSPKQNRVRLIMEQIVQLAHQLTIRTVVEGVETEEDERFIRSIGCDIGQGYLYSRPVSAREFSDKYMEE